ncbi:MAG: hypothetical protein LBJ88_03505 [Campylobacteraceae bacterium]|jgi:SAM-dependent methyltransferase|nr:hypothetical protein [Campylobacteraceae bacterium]
MENKSSRNSKIFTIVLIVLIIGAVFMAGAHFFFLYKVKSVLSNNSLKFQDYEASVKLSDEFECKSVGYIELDCTGGRGSIYLKQFSQNDAVFGFENITLKISAAGVKNMHIFNMDIDFIQGEEKELFSPINFDFKNSGSDDFKASLDGAFGIFNLVGKDNIIKFSYNNDNFREYFHKIFTLLKPNLDENLTFDEFNHAIIGAFFGDYEKASGISTQYVQLLNAAQNLINGKSKGISIEFYMKTKDQDAIDNAFRMMAITKTVNTNVFDVKISNL